MLAAMLHDGEALISGLEVLRSHDETSKAEALSRRGKGKWQGKTGSTQLSLFFHRPYQLLFDLVSDLETRGQPPDFTTIIDEARTQNVLEEIGGAAALLEVVSQAATGTNVRNYADIVVEKYLKRRLIFSSNDVLERAYSDTEDSEALISEAQRDLHSLSDNRHTGAFVKIGDLLGEVQESLLESIARKGLVTGLKTHYHLLDELTAGFQKSDLIILAARPSIGKTALALNIIENVAVQGNIPVGFFSLEMSALQIVQRILCSMSQVDLKRLRSGVMSKRESSSVFNKLAHMAPLPIYIDDTPGLSISSVRARALRLKHREKNLGLIVVDYLQLMEASFSRPGQRNRQEEVSAISRGLKGLARELEVPVLGLSQLSRGVEGRESGIPRLSDLRESGAIEQDADVVIFIHRKKGKEDEGSDEDIKAELIVGKQRNGPVGNVPIAFISHYASFRNLAGSAQAPPEVAGAGFEEIEEMSVDGSVPF